MSGKASTGATVVNCSLRTDRATYPSETIPVAAHGVCDLMCAAFSAHTRL